jgi:hypothetical protein
MLKFRDQTLKQKMFWDLSFAICALSFVILISGCATITEGAKGFVGISTKALEDGRKNALSETFNYDYNSCYHKAKEALSGMGGYIYAEDTNKQMIALYVSAADTTPVGIFFTRIDADNTRIEVSSPSTYAKETIAAKLFSDLKIK